MVGNWDVFW